jgi:hypothetical protein|tara:strand:+ start:274 stop:573 length:300 start_codon:yes stop_codon:yes gene_type:complete
MGHMMNLRLNVAALPKDKMVQGAKGTYIDLTIKIDDQENEYNQSVSSWVAQSEEERLQKRDRVWTGNGRVFWSTGDPLPCVKKKQESTKEKDIDLPFDL